VLDGELSIALRDGGGVDRTGAGSDHGERVVTLPRGAVFVVPRGVEHRPFSPAGAAILMFEPTGTSTVGNVQGPIPDHVDATTGHALGERCP
jgi:mannose-6-phosphate isomerase-like protein (cupin superfamily)